ncbi:hypothetical protein MLD38_027015 [Melastoma candidum]|uniref:Uncharacterized protein n=1 Tax=Melastoma candidum TaxID=119954 RepID=A0ACB9P568_9MYRT|nr:hypothetical protein MLD38_027015 [Melastoma candidum]
MWSAASLILPLYMFLVRQLPIPNHARNAPESFWKEVMKDQPMPDAIKGLLVKDATETAAGFVGDFDFNPNVIIYHGHREDKAEHP